MSDIDAEFTETGTALAVARPQANLALFDTSDPRAFMENATAVAKVIFDVIESQGLAKNLGGTKKHVEIEGWQTLGAMVGCAAVIEWTREYGGDGSGLGWEARAIVKNRHGEVVGAGDGMCLRAEPKWKSKDYFALRSMAQTRAQSRALQGPLRFIMILAGYKGTPEPETIEQEEPPEQPAFDRERAKKHIFAVINELVKSPHERTRNRGKNLQDNDRRHALLAKLYDGKQSLNDLSDDELYDFEQRCVNERNTAQMQSQMEGMDA